MKNVFFFFKPPSPPFPPGLCVPVSSEAIHLQALLATRSLICAEWINIVDGTNIVNLQEEWRRLNSISADNSKGESTHSLVRVEWAALTKGWCRVCPHLCPMVLQSKSGCCFRILLLLPRHFFTEWHFSIGNNYSHPNMWQSLVHVAFLSNPLHWPTMQYWSLNICFLWLNSFMIQCTTCWHLFLSIRLFITRLVFAMC